MKVMEQSQLITLIKNSPVFHDFNELEIAKVIEITEIRKIAQGTNLIQEGEKGNEMFLLLDGLVEVLKKDESGMNHQVAIVEPGETIGEMALLDEPYRSATVRALQDLDVLVFEFERLKAESVVYNKLMLGIAKKLSQRLRKTGDKTVKALQAELMSAKVRIEMGRFLFIILILACAWIFAVTLLKEFTSQSRSSSVVSMPMIAILVLCFIGHVKFSIYPKSYFGLNLRNWKKSLFESIVFTVPILILAVIVKWYLVNHTARFYGRPVFDFHSKPLLYVFLPFLYVLFAPLQEFLARGVLQGSIKASLSGEHTTFWSILLSNLIFATFHAHISQVFSLLAFVFGLFWGWLYHRQWTLVGPSVSHALIGFWCLIVLGFGRILTGH